MNIFASTQFTWWQLGMLKWAVFLIGIAVGATWPDIFEKYTVLLVIIGLVLSAYIARIWLRNK